jgi:hypothetical protein
VWVLGTSEKVVDFHGAPGLTDEFLGIFQNIGYNGISKRVGGFLRAPKQLVDLLKVFKKLRNS